MQIATHGILAASASAIAPSFSNTKSLVFDGVDDCVTMGNVLDTSDTGASAFSVSCWYKTTNSGTQIFVAKQKHGNPFNGFSLTMQPNNKLSFFLGSLTGNKYLYTQTTNVSTHSNGNWHHLVVTYDGSRSTSGMTMYFNGSVKSLTIVKNVAPEGIQNSQDFMLGARGSSSSPGSNLNGSLDEVAYFTSELSASDVTSIYNSGSPGDLTSLSPVSWWRNGDGDTFPTLTDNGSGSNNGTMTNMTSGDIVTDVP